MKELINTQAQMVHQIEKKMNVKIQGWSNKILEAVERKSYVKTDASIDNIGNSNVMEKLYRKYKLYRSAIEIMLLEISQLEQSEVTLIAMKSSLLQVYEKEEQCGLIVQEIISLHKDESIVDQEIRDWTELQQRILRVSTKAEGYIAQMIRNEEVKLRSVEHKTVLNESEDRI